MATPDDVMRILTTRVLAVNSGGGAATSISSVSAQTYAVDLIFITAPIATTGIRFAISDVAVAAVTSTTGALLPANWIQRYKCTPGQIVQAISTDASTYGNFTIVELTK